MRSKGRQEAEHMILDGHIHMGFTGGKKGDSPKTFRRKLAAGGIDGGIVISPSPRRSQENARERMKSVMRMTAGGRNLFPFFWIEPRDPDALYQVDEAVKMGIRGFKVICNEYFPCDRRPMEVWTHIARRKKPILFHSGILWDGTPSSNFNRPANWEAMLNIKGIRFAMAHISWPWVDEHVAVYGKIESAKYRGAKEICEMFIDTTPGTPTIYRRDALYKVFKVGYQVERNVFFGTDHHAESFWVKGAHEKVDLDRGLLTEMEVPEKVQEAYFAENLRRFVG